MELNLSMSINRRRQEMYNFYYRGIGDRIKKRRKELQWTQELLAKGICSNTYISKLENNKIVVNKEHLLLLMERMGLPTDKIGYPEKMVDILEKSILYFFHKDVVAFQQLFEEIEKYEFGILIYVARLGYYVLTKDFDNAKTIYDDMYRYLNSLEEYGFAAFLIFGGFYNVGIHDYQTARMIIESVEGKIQNDEFLFGLYSYLKFIVYGNLHYFNCSRDAYSIAETIFMDKFNVSRIHDLLYYKNISFIFEGALHCVKSDYDVQFISDLSDKSYYLIIKSLVTENKLDCLNQLEPEGDYYIDGLYLKARYLYKNNKLEDYKKTKTIINDIHYKLQSKIDYLNLLKLYEDGEWLYVKDYLINYVLPYLVEYQQLFLIKSVIQEIVQILESKKRYKDALTYLKKYDAYKEKFQTKKKITL